MPPVGPRDLAKSLRSAFSPQTEANVIFSDLAPPIEVLQLVDAYVASATPSATLSEALIELSYGVARGKERSEAVGRTSAWLIVLSKLCNEDIEGVPRSAVGEQLWPGLLKKVLLTAPEAGITLSRDAVAAAKALLLYALDDSTREGETLTALEEQVLAEYLDLTAFVEGESDARTRWSKGRERGASHLEDVLLALGRQRPKAFFAHLARWLAVKPAQRGAILRLVSDFCRSHPAQAHHAVPSKLVDGLLNAILIDDDVYTVQTALSIINAILPRIPSSLEALLPTLLAAYARALSLADLGKTKAQLQAEDGTRSPEPPPALRLEVAWLRQPEHQDALQPEYVPRQLVQDLFAFLYGVLPCNTVAFLRTPLDYLAQKDWASPYADGPSKCFDQGVLWDRAELIFCAQSVHPSLVYSNPASELADLQRLSKSEAADILLIVQRYSLPTSSPIEDTLQSGLITPIRSPPLTDAYSSMRALASPSTSELLLQSPSSTSSRPRAPSESIAKLERDLFLLRSELAYELFLKQQHSERLGALHRDRINKASTDAERQALSDSLKFHKTDSQAAKAQIEKERLEYMRIKTANKSRLVKIATKQAAQAAAGEAATTLVKEDAVRIASMQATIAAQAEQLESAEQKLLDLESQAKIDAPKLEEREQMEARIKRLTQFLLAWDQDMSKAKIQRKQMEGIVSEWQKALELRDHDAEQIASLTKALRDAEDRLAQATPPTRSTPPHAKADRPSAAARADMVLREQYAELRRKAQAMEKELVSLRASRTSVP